MPRAIRTEFLADLEAVNSEDMEVVLLTISYPSFTVRLVRDVVDYVWRGDTYFGAMFELIFLSDDEKEPRGTLRVPNVDRQIGESILAIEESPSLRIDILEGSSFSDLVISGIVSGGGFGAFGEFAYGGGDFDGPFPALATVVLGYKKRTMYGDAAPIITADNLFLKNVRCTAQTVEADIVALELSVEPFPGVRATKNLLPGLYR